MKSNIGILSSKMGAFRQYVLDKWQKHPELFPDSLEQGGFWFHDFVVSTKQQLPIRRIKLKQNQQVYQLRPDFVMPYMILLANLTIEGNQL